MHRGSGDFIEPPKNPGGNGDLHAQNLQTPVSSQSLGFPQSSLPQYMFAGHLQSINTHSRQAMGTLQGVRGHSPQPPGFSASSQIVSSTTVLPQAVSVTSQNLSRSGGSTSVFAAATPMRISPHGSTTVNVLQRQLSSPGILGMQSVGTSVGYHQQSLVSQVGTHGTVSFQDTHTVQQILSYPSTSSVSVSGRTIHHHGQSSSSGCLTPLTSTTQQSNLNLHLTQRHGSLISNSLTKPVLDATTYVPFTTTSNTGAPPRKKIKLEEKAPNTPEIAVLRKKILDYKHREMRELKENYVEHLTELFFLKNGGNIMDFSSAKKRPTFQLVQFLKSGNLDSDEDDEQENISEENKCAATMESSSNVSIATSLPSAVATVAQQGSSSVSSAVDPSYISVSNVPTATTTTVTPLSTIQSQPDCTPVTISASTVISQFSKSVAETKSSSQIIKNALSSPTITCQTSISRPPKSPTSPSQRLNTRQQAISAVYDSTIGSQEAIVERAKQEAQVMQRVAELRKEGMWSARRLPKVQEPPRNKAHWDYLLEEMQWLAADFAQERKWKKAAARKISRMVAKYHQEQEQKEIRAEKEEAQKLKRIAGQIAKQVKEFWANIEKVVQHKQQTRLDEKRKKALDIHLNFIVDQTEKYSSWLTEGLTGRSSVASSAVGSMPGTPEHSSTSGDDDFEPAQSETDDEETIEREEREAGFDETATQQELETLQQESEVPLEELLKTLPEDILEKPASLSSCEESDEAKEGDGEFHLEEEQADVEETIAEQENHERKIDHSKEIEELEAEGEMSLDELVKKYTGAYLSDLELEDQGSGDEEDEDYEDDDDDDDDLTSDDEDGTDNEMEVGEEEEEDVKQTEEIGLEYLMHPEKEESFEKQMPATPEGKGPSKEITDIAAEAQSLQPKGYTLETTQVKVAVPFLLKHKLREYQHVGLDWLVTMHDKKLNGILADEMGLGKTIQTIALLAHLACETGVWGPHLIVVPTSVMLNWEMEFKKWCPAFKILTYYGNPKERKQKRQGWTKTNAFHVCITSYKLVIQDHQAFRRKKWKYFILDEAQNIKNFKSQRWQTLLNFQSQRRLLLTGTPLQNSLMELWSLMHFLMPNVFQSHREFKEWFSNPLSGMIEGSHEYNESLIKRLHKVLRPFLLRRLKDDVEKQMPKKYEHVIMCRLSKRQRFLYDEFMSLTKTKETLASGHFMSVINVLMQLRKVCNHPNLFDARPIISPFQTEGLVYFTASLVLRALESDPFKTVDLHCLYPSLSEMEQNLPKFVAERICKLQTSRSFIMEIDNHPEPLPRPKPTKLKPLLISRAVCPFVPAGRASPVTPISPALPPVSVVKHSLIKPVAVTPMPQVSPAAVPAATPAAAASVPIRIGLVSQQQPQQQSGQPQHLQAVLMSSAAVTNQRPSVPLSSIATSLPGVQATIQAKVLPQTLHGTAASSVIPSQPITVQIQQTDQGTRLMIPTGQLSQFSTGFIQIVQTSSGQQLIATSTPPVQSVIPMQTVTSTTSMPVVNGPARVSTVTASPVAVTTSIAAVPALVKTTPTVHLPITTAAAASGKPVMKVQPLSTELPSTSTVLSKTCIQQIIPSKIVAHEQVKQGRTVPVKLLKQATKSEFFLESLHQKRIHCKREKLDYIVRTNKKRCDMKPIYGQDLFDAVSITNNLKKNQPDQPWTGLGHFHCKCVHRCHLHSNAFWNQTEALQRIVHKPEQYLDELQHILERYVFVTPAVSAPCITMHVSHPPPSYLTENKYRGYILHTQLSPKAACLHKISANTTVQFPELRLIQYDCGKLQTMDVLLRKLKTEQHRVLIFTQMTKMLDVLEAFLNYHGHRYLRLDGTTKVEQRQALMERFNADKRIFCFILSTRSGGLGVNLTGADTVIFYDSDWNPTMDAQAQDRCHRIGQTRDVHIYRLISERTVEENILKKADQKRLLGDVAIEGGNFTTAYFKEHTIKDLFEEPSGLENLAKDKERRILKEETGNKDTSYITQLEQALCKAEDETDALAADLVKAEQKAELAEFDEDIPWDDKEAERKQEEEELSKAEQELAMLENELSPVERYAITFVETHMEPFCREELTIAGEDIEKVKKDWELTRLKALKEEEEIRAELEEDEMLFTYSRDDAYNQVYECEADQEPMPLWAPPTPPQDDNDVYIDQTMFFLYEPTTMPETQLPPVYIRKEHKRPKVETVTTRKQKQRKEEQPRVPRSLFDRPTAALLKMRREAKLQKLKHGLIKPYRPVSVVTNKQTMEPSQDHPEWLIHEDWALLQAVQTLLELTLNLTVLSPAHIANWELVADVVNSCSCIYRSPKQCKNRYENVIIPREEGRILYDVNPRKQKKTKGIYKTKNNRPMKTSQLYSQDSNVSVSMLYSVRFDAIKSMAAKRQPPMRQTVTSQNQKNPKHIAVLQDNGITFEQPLNPVQVATIRADRILREKKQSQAAAQASAEQQLAAQRSQPPPPTQVSQQTVVSHGIAQTVTAGQAQQLQSLSTAVSNAVMQTGTLTKADTVRPVMKSVSISSTKGGARNIVINTTGAATSNTFPTINKRMTQPISNVSQATTVAVTASLSPAVRAAHRQPTSLTVQDLTAVAGQAQTVLPTTAPSVLTSTSLAAMQMSNTQRIAAGTTTTAATVQQQLTQKGMSQQLQILKQQQQQQQIRNSKLQPLGVVDQLKFQQQMKRMQTQAQTVSGQKSLPSKIISGVVQVQSQKPATKTPVTRTFTETDMMMLKHRQQQAQKTVAQTGQQTTQTQGQTISTAQIIAQAQVQPVGQTATPTLVKTISAPLTSMPVPVSMTQPKGKTASVGHLQQQPVKQVQFQQLQQQKKAALQQAQKVQTLGQAQVTGKSALPLGTTAVQIIPSHSPKQLPLTMHQLNQIIKQQPQIITTVPTIIATVNQGQPAATHMVAKVSLASGSSANQIQTIPTTHVSMAASSAIPSTRSMGTPVAQTTAAMVKTTVAHECGANVQVHPLHTGLTQPAKITALTSAVVTQGLHQVQTGQISSASVQQMQSVVAHAGQTSTVVSVTPATQTIQHPTTVVTQSQPSIQSLAQQTKSSHYAMRTRNPQKH